MKKHIQHGLTAALIAVSILALSGCAQNVSPDASATQDISSQHLENTTLAFVDEDESTEDAQKKTKEKATVNTEVDTPRQTDMQTKKKTTDHSSTDNVSQKTKTKEKSKKKKKQRADKSDENIKETQTDSEQQPASESKAEKDVLTSTTKREHTVSEKKGEWGATV